MIGGVGQCRHALLLGAYDEDGQQENATAHQRAMDGHRGRTEAALLGPGAAADAP